MSAQAIIKMPVWLPGNDYNWEKKDGVATITEDGEINIKLMEPSAALAMVAAARDGNLVGISFAYVNPAVPKENND